MAADEVQAIEALAEKVKHNVQLMMVGKAAVVELAMVALLCEGHMLIEDVPGLGKTVLLESLKGSVLNRLKCCSQS